MNQIRKSIALATLSLCLTLTLAPTAYSMDYGFNSGAKTPQEITGYLIKMKAIIKRYDETVMGMVLGANGVNNSPEAMTAAGKQTQQLANDIRAIKPPDEMAASHGQLATCLMEVQKYIGNQGGQTNIAGAFALAGQVQGSMKSYYNDVTNLIVTNGLSPSLNPFSDETDAQKQRAMQGLNQLKTQVQSTAAANNVRTDAGAPVLGSKPAGSGGGNGGVIDPMGDINALGNMMGVKAGNKSGLQQNQAMPQNSAVSDSGDMDFTNGSMDGGASGGIGSMGSGIGSMGSGGGGGAGGLGALGGLMGGGGGAGGLGALGGLMGGGGGAGGLGALGGLMGGGGGGGAGGLGALGGMLGGGGGAGGADLGSGADGSFLQQLGGMMGGQGGGTSGGGAGAGGGDPAAGAFGGFIDGMKKQNEVMKQLLAE